MATVEAKRRKLTQEDCDTVRYLLKHERTLKEIGEIIHVDPSTVGKIRLADYNLQTYLEQRKQMNRKTAEKKRAKGELIREINNPHLFMRGPFDYANDAVRGQMHMDLQEERNGGDGSAVPQERNGENRPLVPEADKTAKMMKFQAAMMDKLLKKLDELIDVLKGGAGNE